MDVFSIAGDIVIIIAVLGVGVGIGRWLTRLDQKIGVLGGKVNGTFAMLTNLITILAEGKIVDAGQVSKLHGDYEETISNFEAGISNPITPEMSRRRKELSVKLDSNTITMTEAKELKRILDTELTEAKEAGNVGAILAIIGLSAMIIGIIAALSSKE